MIEALIQKLDDYTRQSHAGELQFPIFLGKLTELGVERYHTDYSRHENTYYLADGQSHVVVMPDSEHTISNLFDTHKVEVAVRQSQRNEHSYQDFVHKTMTAGCVGYFVQITGRRALYFGRHGEVHTEPFPTAQRD